MTRRIEVDAETGDVVVSFRFDRTIKDAVKAIAGARFHGNSRTWRFPGERLSAVVSTLQPLGFAWTEPPPRVARLDARLDAPSDAPALRARAPERQSQPLSEDATIRIRDVNRAIGEAIDQRFRRSFWVAGELVNYDKNRATGHAWFELVDVELDAGTDGRRQSSGTVMRAVAFASARDRMVHKMGAQGLALADGLTVRMRVRVEFYAPKGSIQLQVEDIDVAWSAGALALRREQVVREVAERGLAERQPAMEIPAVPLRVALLTSFESDAYFDVLSGLRVSGMAFDVTPLDVRVQGEGLSRSVCAALAWVAERRAEFDVVIITRGGGSRVELGGWDDLPVALAVAQLPVKVLVAIGHQQDRCALDDIAEAAKTPTEAAERLAALARGALARAATAADCVGRAAAARIATATAHTNQTALHVARHTRRNLDQQRAYIDATLPRLLARATTTAINNRRSQLQAADARLSPAQAARPTQRRHAQCDALQQRLLRAIPSALKNANRSLDHAAHTIKLVHPDNILQRGFAILRDPDGKPIASANGLQPGDPLTVQTAQHDLTVDIKHINTRVPTA